VYGYVIMPEHVHLLISEPENGLLLARAIQALKTSMNLKTRLSGPSPLWQKRYYDHNVRSYESFVVKLKYIHRNPVKRGLWANPLEWEWSSFRHYATAQAGAVEIESEWTAERRSGREPRLMRAPEH
jgi:REP-associated tyrosine transposase